MPYSPGGSFTLVQGFGTGTPPSNDFPPQVGSTLDDIAANMNTATIASVGHFIQWDVTTTTTVGYKFTAYNAGTISSGSFTPDAANGNYQYVTNNGSWTWNAPAADSAMDVLVTNGPSVGTITFSGFTVAVGNTGDLFTTVNTNKFVTSIRRINGTSTYINKALQ